VKKLSAILLIALFLFNLYGYRLVFNYAQQQSDATVEASLDKNDFDESELVTITVPVSVPYQNNQQDFERIDGELKLNGKIYKYVKRKLSDGQLILKCLPDHKKMQLESAKDEFFKYANDLVQNNQSKKSDHSKFGVFKNLIGEYDHVPYQIITASSNVSVILYNKNYLAYFPSMPHFSPDQPPEFLV
jgi:hypothetical protein